MEWAACAAAFAYWCDRWVQVYDPVAGAWIPFRLWPRQREVARLLQTRQLLVMLKARQLGMSWLTAAYGLWLMLFRPAATVLIFSKRDDEAVQLLARRLRGMYDRLPDMMQAEAVLVANEHELRLSNGSAALAFPTTGGRSYTATLAIVDEADYAAGPGGNLGSLLEAVKPTVDAGGQLVLVSTVDKKTPGSAFKRIYQAARLGENSYTPVFLPWSARPDRTPEWYAAVQQDILARSGNLDALYAEYPASDAEALAALSSDARFPAAWLAAADDTAAAERTANHQEPKTQSFTKGALCDFDGSVLGGATPPLQNLVVYEGPGAGRIYVIGADPAEGNPQSDESAACVLEAETGHQVAVWAGRVEPGAFAAGLHSLAQWYRAPAGPAAADQNFVGILVERNNHGHTVLHALREVGEGGIVNGRDGRPGWLTTLTGKALLVDAAAELLRDGIAMGCPPRVRDAETLRQLSILSGSTLAAPYGDHDDRCIAWCLAVAGARQIGLGKGQYAILPPNFAIDTRDTGGW